MKTLVDFANKKIGEQQIRMLKYLCDCNDFIKDSHINFGNYLDTGYQYDKVTGIQDLKWNQVYSTKQDEDKKRVIEKFNLVCDYDTIYKPACEEALMHKATLISMSNKMCHDFIYGNHKIVGLAEHYSNRYKNKSSHNVVNAGNNNPYLKNSSIYLVIWDDDKIFTFIPQLDNAGFFYIDQGCTRYKELDIEENKHYFEWKMGFAVQDWRYAGRICNINVDNINASLIDQMCELEERIKSFQLGRAVWYMNRDVKFGLRKVIGNRKEIQYIPNVVTYRPEMYFNQIPVHICDEIRNDESIVDI